MKFLHGATIELLNKITMLFRKTRDIGAAFSQAAIFLV